MRGGRARLARRLAVLGIAAGTLLLALPRGVGAQEPVASTATARGYEGLFYNPAATAVGRYQALGLGGCYEGGGSYSLSLGLLDSLLLQYERQELAERFALRCGLGLSLGGSLYGGLALQAQWPGFSWERLGLDAGLLWYPSRYLALGATAGSLLGPGSPRYTVGLGVRPFTDRVTLFGDLIFPEGFGLAELDGAAGLRAEIVQGIEAGVRLEDRFQRYALQLGLSSGSLGLDLYLAGDFALQELRVGAALRAALRPARSVLELRPRSYTLTLDQPLRSGSTDAESLYDADNLVARIYQLAEDPACRTLVLIFDATAIRSMTVLEQLRGAIDRFRDRGKRLVSYLQSSFSELDYLAAALGDRVVASPYSVVPLVGVGGRFLFYKELFERLGIELDYARSSEYKAALDSYLREELSPENRRQWEEYLQVGYRLMVGTLSSGRGFSQEQARGLIDGGPYWCEEAAALGLVDEVLYQEEFEEKYLAQSGAAPLRVLRYQDRSWRKPQVAVLTAAGDIVSSQAVGPLPLLLGQPCITEKNLLPLLAGLRADPRVAAVVLQVDSGGGDGLLSDRIWRAILTLEERKPVVVVMGGAAASGGYYLAMAGGRVFAQRTTLTGSIGSFIFKPVVLELLQRLGITTDSVSYGANYDLFSPYAPLSQQQQERLAALNEAFTTRFYRRVAESRGLPYEEVQSLGGGRIYSGERALELNLVDEIGGLWQALRYLEGDLGLEPDDYTLRYYPDQRTRVLLALQQLQQGLVRSLR